MLVKNHRKLHTRIKRLHTAAGQLAICADKIAGDYRKGNVDGVSRMTIQHLATYFGYGRGKSFIGRKHS